MDIKRSDLKEEISATFKISRKAFLINYFMSLVIIVAAGYMVFFSEYGVNALVFYISLIFVFLLLIFPELHRMNHIYSLTDEFLLHTWGIGTRQTKRISYDPISDIDVAQTPWQMLLMFGDVRVHVFSKDSIVCLKNVNRPKRVAKAIERAKQRAKEKAFKLRNISGGKG